MTYLKPRKFLHRLLKIFAMCQTKTIFEQYGRGIRKFDLRIRFNDNLAPIFAHGLIEFDRGETLYRILDTLASYGDCDCRIVHEDTRKSDRNYQSYMFSKLIHDVEKRYGSDIHFIEYRRKSDWALISSSDSRQSFYNNHEHLELYASSWYAVEDGKVTIKRRWRNLLSFCPIIYAFFMNKRNIRKYGDNYNLMIDFV